MPTVVIAMRYIRKIAASVNAKELPLGSLNGLDMPCLIKRPIMPKIINNNNMTAITP